MFYSFTVGEESVWSLWNYVNQIFWGKWISIVQMSFLYWKSLKMEIFSMSSSVKSPESPTSSLLPLHSVALRLWLAAAGSCWRIWFFWKHVKLFSLGWFLRLNQGQNGLENFSGQLEATVGFFFLKRWKRWKNKVWLNKSDSHSLCSWKIVKKKVKKKKLW